MKRGGALVEELGETTEQSKRWNTGDVRGIKNKVGQEIEERRTNQSEIRIKISYEDLL